MNFAPLAVIPDVSVYQGKTNFTQMRTICAGVIIRAGQNLWTDEAVAYNWAAAKQAGLQRGSYWYYDSRADPIQQAQKWKTVLGNDVPEWGLWIDLEESYNGAYRGEAHWRKFAEAVRVQFQNIKIGIYTANWWWSQQTVWQADYWASFPLWVASYTSVQNATLPKAWVTRGAVLWQYTSTGNGALYGVASTGIDLNYTAQAFYDLFGAAPVCTGGSMLYGRVNTAALNIRTGPGAVYADIGDLLLNDYVVATENVGGWWHLQAAYRGGWTGAPVQLAGGTLINTSAQAMYCKDAYIVVVPPPPPVVVPPAATLASLTIEPTIGTVLTFLYSDGTVKRETVQ